VPFLLLVLLGDHDLQTDTSPPARSNEMIPEKISTTQINLTTDVATLSNAERIPTTRLASSKVRLRITQSTAIPVSSIVALDTVRLKKLVNFPISYFFA